MYILESNVPRIDILDITCFSQFYKQFWISFHGSINLVSISSIGSEPISSWFSDAIKYSVSKNILKFT